VAITDEDDTGMRRVEEATCRLQSLRHVKIQEDDVGGLPSYEQFARGSVAGATQDLEVEIQEAPLDALHHERIVSDEGNRLVPQNISLSRRCLPGDRCAALTHAIASW
jgi:hypothetical protein